MWDARVTVESPDRGGSPDPHHRLPLFLDLRGRRAVVVGGGPVAARRASDLVSAGAAVEVVAPYACEDLVDLADRGELRWVRREFRQEDLTDAWLVVTATGDRAVDQWVVANADSLRVWAVNSADGESSPAWSATAARIEDGVSVAVTGGGDPRRARAVRQRIERLLSAGEMPLRRRRGGDSSRAQPQGRVYLVGGGPGDPDLLTVRGSRLLSMADVVVVDRLAPWEALDGLAEDVEVIDVGKAPGNHALPQAEINQLLIERASAGKIVVRLKGGDPFVLGRGGEEAIACAAAGIPVEVVPGVTSAVSVPAAAGIPVTHRGVAQSFLMASAHSAGDALEQLARVGPSVTVVLLMGVGRLAEVGAGLVAAGRDPATPVAVIERGWTPRQREVRGTLTTIAALAHAAGIASPAVIVIGDVVAVDTGLESWSDSGVRCTPPPSGAGG
jgi:uroporphyrin-III C-methyltransferase/precorrin-2 dehydrogenase/sirohydrochlorin ferrochelatase